MEDATFYDKLVNYFTKKYTYRIKSCKLCGLRGNKKNPVSYEDVDICLLFQICLVPHNPLKLKETILLRLCSKCKDLIDAVSSLVAKLRDLRKVFLQLQSKVGEQVLFIVGRSIRLPSGDRFRVLQNWQKEVSKKEQVYPEFLTPVEFDAEGEEESSTTKKDPEIHIIPSPASSLPSPEEDISDPPDLPEFQKPSLKNRQFFRCPHCSKSIRRRHNNVSTHLALHFPQKASKKRSCTHCDLRLLTAASLRRHRILKHRLTPPNTTPHECPCCLKHFPSAVDLQRHTLKIHKVSTVDAKNVDLLSHMKKIRCSICPNATFLNSLEMLKEHSLSEEHTKVASFHNIHCSTCQTPFTSTTELQCHLDSPHHKKQVEEAKSGSPRNKKLLKKTKSRGFPCDICGKHFTRRFNLEIHKKTLHTEDGLIPCATCSRSFASFDCLMSHVASDHPDTPRKPQVLTAPLRLTLKCPHSTCPSSEGSFPSFLSLRRHLYTLHPKEYFKERPYACGVCFRSFPQPQILEEHLRSAKNSKCGGGTDPTTETQLPLPTI